MKCRYQIFGIFLLLENKYCLLSWLLLGTRIKLHKSFDIHSEIYQWHMRNNEHNLQVHERQTERMRTRSEWFLTPTDAAQFGCAFGGCLDSDPTLHVLRGANTCSSSSNIGKF